MINNPTSWCHPEEYGLRFEYISIQGFFPIVVSESHSHLWFDLQGFISSSRFLLNSYNKIQLI